jgi:hypothetical protein
MVNSIMCSQITVVSRAKARAAFYRSNIEIIVSNPNRARMYVCVRSTLRGGDPPSKEPYQMSINNIPNHENREALDPTGPQAMQEKKIGFSKETSNLVMFWWVLAGALTTTFQPLVSAD